MRHRSQHRKLNRTSAHRKALFRNQLTALLTHERIVTTVAKAKELRPIAERMVTLARTGSLPARRKVLTMVPNKEIVSRLFEDIAPRFMDRPGGYTRIMRVGRRHGDGAELAIIEFVDYDLADHEDGGSRSTGKASLMDRAKGMFGGGAKPEGDSTADTAEDVQEATTDQVGEEIEVEASSIETDAPEVEAEEPVKEPEPVEESLADDAETSVEETVEAPEEAAAEAEAVDEDEEEKK